LSPGLNSFNAKRLRNPKIFRPMNYKILVVDDSETSLLLIQSIFDGKEDMNILLESSGQKALDHLTTSQPDLIVLDLLMPELDGFEFLKQAKANPKNRNIPIIVLTALQDHDSEKKALELGATDYIRKPLDINEVEEKIYRCL